MKIKELFKRLTPSFLCAHANKHSVIIRDYYFDEMIYNDDLDDIIEIKHDINAPCSTYSW